MRARLRGERGATLIELLVAMSLMTVILSATLLLFEAGADNNRLVDEHNEAQDTARRHTDRLARELRNMASPSLLTTGSAQPLAVDLATDYDLVFRTVDDIRPAGSANTANVKRVRYCLNADDPASGRLYRQQQTWTTEATPPMPSTTSCPGTGWTAAASTTSTGSESTTEGETETEATSTTTSTTEYELVTDGVVNRIGGQSRPLFIFDSADTSRISRLRTDVHVDPTPARSPVETRLTTGVFLRNQNRVPVASFTVDANAATNEVVLNGSPSEDPEDMPLEYTWFIDGVEIGEGVVFTHAGAADGVHIYRLEVRDPADLADDATMEVSL